MLLVIKGSGGPSILCDFNGETATANNLESRAQEQINKQDPHYAWKSFSMQPVEDRFDYCAHYNGDK